MFRRQDVPIVFLFVSKFLIVFYFCVPLFFSTSRAPACGSTGRLNFSWKQHVAQSSCPTVSSSSIFVRPERTSRAWVGGRPLPTARAHLASARVTFFFRQMSITYYYLYVRLVEICEQPWLCSTRPHSVVASKHSIHKMLRTLSAGHVHSHIRLTSTCANEHKGACHAEESVDWTSTSYSDIIDD